MKILLVSVGEHDDYRVVAVYTAAKAGDAAKVAALVGGRVEVEGGECQGSTTLPLMLNQFPAEAPPKMAKAFYSFVIERSGKVSGMTAGPLLQPDGKLQEPRYDLDSYALRAEKGYAASVRKSHWRLHVSCYADSEDSAAGVGQILKEDVFHKRKPAAAKL